MAELLSSRPLPSQDIFGEVALSNFRYGWRPSMPVYHSTIEATCPELQSDSTNLLVRSIELSRGKERKANDIKGKRALDVFKTPDVKIAKRVCTARPTENMAGSSIKNKENRDEGPFTEAALRECTSDRLKSLLKNRLQQTTGRKEDLVQRMLRHQLRKEAASKSTISQPLTPS